MNKEDIVIDDLDLVFFDTETTGLELKHEVIQIGLVKVKAKTFEVLAEKDIKIKPTHIENANPQALQINGYNEAEWASAADLKTGLQDFLNYTQDCVLVAHNLSFDWMQIKKSLDQCGLTANYMYKGLDTFSLAWQKLHHLGKFQKYSMKELAWHFGIDQGHAHRALDDARTAYQVFKKLMAL